MYTHFELLKIEIAKKFEEAEKLRAKEGNIHPALYYMDEQIYAANSGVNEVLKIYFPEQFGERDFLDYPIGHFFISVTNTCCIQVKQAYIAIKPSIITISKSRLIKHNKRKIDFRIVGSCKVFKIHV